MNKILFTTILLIFALNTNYAQVFSNIYDVCKTGADPNLIAALNTIDQRVDCSIVRDTVNNITYEYDASLPVGSRWVASSEPPLEQYGDINFITSNTQPEEGQTGVFRRPFDSFEDTASVYSVLPGTYTFTGPFPTDNSQRVSKADGSFYTDGQSEFIWSTTQNELVWPAFSDVVNTSTRAAVPTKFNIYAPNSSFTVDGGTLNGVIGFWNPRSEVNIKARSLKALCARGIAIWSAARKLSADIDTILFTADIGIIFATPRDTAGTITDTVYVSKNWDIKVKHLEQIGTRSGQTAIVRFQNNEVGAGDSLSTYRVKIGYARALNNSLFDISKSENNPLPYTDIIVSYKVNEAEIGVQGSNVPLALFNSFTFGSGFGFREIKRSNITVSANKVKILSSAGDIWKTSRNKNEETFAADSIEMNFKLGIVTGADQIADITSQSRIKNSIVDFKCQSCNSLRGFDIQSIVDTGTVFTITGNYKVESGPFMTLTGNEGTIILKDVLIDAPEPIITSTVPVTIYVSGAFSMQGGEVGPNVTLVRLDELGAIDQNGIISALPQGPVTIGANNNLLRIDTAGMVIIQNLDNSGVDYQFTLSNNSSIPTLISRYEGGDTTSIRMQGSEMTLKNSSGEITLSEIIRKPSTGQLAYNSPTEYTEGVNETLTGAASSELLNFTATDSTLTYAGPDAKVLISYSTKTFVSANSSGEFISSSEVYLNDVEQNLSEAVNTTTVHGLTGIGYITNTGSYITQLTSGDVIKLKINCVENANATFTNLGSTLNVFELK